MPGKSPREERPSSLKPSRITAPRRVRLVPPNPEAIGDIPSPGAGPEVTTSSKSASNTEDARHGITPSSSLDATTHSRSAVNDHFTSHSQLENPPEHAREQGSMEYLAPSLTGAQAPPAIRGAASTGSLHPTTASPSSQQQLSEYREKLARDLERRELSAKGLQLLDKPRASPLVDHQTSESPLITSLTSTSTESGNTIRGGMTPAYIANTPSYPFPRMAPGNAGSSYLQRTFNLASPASPSGMSPVGSFEFPGIQDKLLSGNSTPSSSFIFNPSGQPQLQHEITDFPTPNLYDLSLMLTSEPGLDAWWNTVVQIMRDVYKAERVTLSVPADTTDIENVPWGQKATYNEHATDDLSLGYMGRGDGTVQSSDQDPSEGSAQFDLPSGGAAARPGLLSRHSYTSYEDKKERAQNGASAMSTRRPDHLSRSRSYFPGPADKQQSESPAAIPPTDRTELNRSALDEIDAEDTERIPGWEAPYAPPQLDGRVLPILQALDYEADPLIDHTGIMRVVERGRVVALTRTYPYLSNEPPAESGLPKLQTSKNSTSDSVTRKPLKHRTDSQMKLSYILPSSTSARTASKAMDKHGYDKSKYNTARAISDTPPRPPTPKYEEYEQAPPSPWSQSPAPSPAVRADPKENPFFADASVDEESFNPDPSPADYTDMRPPEAIGVDNSWTVLHIPMTHVLHSKTTTPFKLDATCMEQRLNPASHVGNSTPKSRDTDADNGTSSDSAKRRRPAPIAILSMLSPIIPYPANLRHSLDHLSQHLATSFSLARQYSNLEIEIAGMRRRRPHTTGFGAIAADGRPVDTPSFVTAADIARQQSVPGSITSPSDYSSMSKSATGSAPNTPSWELGTLNIIADRRPPVLSPAAMAPAGEGYFASKQRPVSAHHRSWAGSKDSSPGEKRFTRFPSIQASESAGLEAGGSKVVETPDEVPIPSSRNISSRESRDAPIPDAGDDIEASRTDASRLEPSSLRFGHTRLHSYGADFASTFQSLPPSSSLMGRSRPATPSRTGSVNMVATDMPPPSDRLKGLILDALPAQVFVALPQTGEIVWVNSRFLAYRGLTVAALSVDPFGSIHADDREAYLKQWTHSVRTGEPFSETIRIRRFDGTYRYFLARAVASKDKRGVIKQFLGSYMDIHDRHIAELKAARQEEIEASEAKHRLLANLIPQIIFTATEEDGITFANEQWLSYTGQTFEDALGLGFMDFVHPEDLAKCKIPTDQPPTPLRSRHGVGRDKRKDAESSSDDRSSSTAQASRRTSTGDVNLRGIHQALSRHNSSSSDSVYELPTADLDELARKGVIKVANDSNGRPSYTTEVRLRSKSGEYRWHLIRCVEIDTIDFGSGASSYFGSATDINDHKLLEAKLKEAMESKGRFLSNMSHEIRTPLIGISGMVSFLQDTTLNEEQLDYTNTIQTSANSLIMIINDILDLSKVDAGMMKLKYEWFHTRSLIEDVNELVSTMAIAKRLELNYLVEADVPAWLKGDKVRIRQVLLNVIGNAIKFTTEGEVFSRCKVLVEKGETARENEIMLEFAIMDTGRGFTKKEAELIFKPFSQIDGSSTRQHGGSGLGLVISRQLVELHGGTMEGTAIPGRGSTFTFTARFSLPTADDHPNISNSPPMGAVTPSQRPSPEALTATMKTSQPLQRSRPSGELSPATMDVGFQSPTTISTGSSNPSIHSGRSHVTDRSSVTSVNTGLARFSEAAKASGQDLSQMKLALPTERTSPSRTATPSHPNGDAPPERFRPPMYSILVLCPQYHSREATTAHIEMTLPKEVPHQITALATVDEAQNLIGGDDPIKFTHIVINLNSAEAVLDLLDRISKFQSIERMMIIILTDSVQRQEMVKLTAETKHEHFLTDNMITFIYKPVKPSRLAVIFDPEKMRDLSIDRNRSTAQAVVENQKASYLEIRKRMVNKGYKVLLVEDNEVNQKVLRKYLEKIGVAVEIANNGVECTDMVFSKPHHYYSIILCDLQMPRKDGYQACREIREWERRERHPKMPIIALSANVMLDVQEKCFAAGFSEYVTKPIDFVTLSGAMSKFV
jgi:signal transduction histidine kinase/CheY-like chemotaxis protein